MTADEALKVVLHQSQPVPLDVDFSCEPGELLALVGPSGSGKTTILRCIAGLHQAQRGSVHSGREAWWDDHARINVPVYRRRVGMVFQSYALFEHMSAEQNIAVAMGGNDGNRQQRIHDLMALVNLSGLESRKPAQLSGGQCQRVALARALAGEPRVLLLDEPFSAVDLMTRRRLRRELASIRQTLNIPIILVTHDLEEAEELADTMCIVHHGRTLQIARPERVMSMPVSAEVARLVGHTNLFEAEVTGVDSGNGTATIDWQGLNLECKSQFGLQTGQTIQWMVPANMIILHQRCRPSRGEAENPVQGRLMEVTRLGGQVRLSLLPAHGSIDTPLTFAVPLHVAERNQLKVGENIGVSLPAQSIHLMPTDQE